MIKNKRPPVYGMIEYIPYLEFETEWFTYTDPSYEDFRDEYIGAFDEDKVFHLFVYKHACDILDRSMEMLKPEALNALLTYLGHLALSNDDVPEEIYPFCLRK
jgi:hypothetical protein